jgi:hypothetical protein
MDGTTTVDDDPHYSLRESEHLFGPFSVIPSERLGEESG